MRERHRDAHTQLPCTRLHLAVQHDLGLLAARRHLHVLPAPRAHAERLRDRLLGTEARRQVLAGTRACGSVRTLAVREEPRRQAGPPLDRALEALDLQQVQPDAAHSTVTVFARFRGWSTFRPRLPAIA